MTGSGNGTTHRRSAPDGRRQWRLQHLAKEKAFVGPQCHLGTYRSGHTLGECALAAHCLQYTQPVVTYENLAAELHDCLAFEPVFKQPAEKPAKTPGEVGESKFVKPVAQRLVKVVTADINTFSMLLMQNHPGSTHAASILFLPRANRPWHSCFTRALHYLSGGGAKLRQIAHRSASRRRTQKLPAARRSESVKNLETKVRQVAVGMLSPGRRAPPP